MEEPSGEVGVAGPATRDAESQFRTHLEACVDARSVYTAIENKDTKVPLECSLLPSIQSVRELIDEHRLRRFYWVDTRDMLPDGLTKGSVDRVAILRLIEKNLWVQEGDPPVSVSAYVEPCLLEFDDFGRVSNWAIYSTQSKRWIASDVPRKL